MKRFFRVLYAVLLSCMLLACSSGNGETEVYVRNGVRVVLNPLSETESLQEHIKPDIDKHYEEWDAKDVHQKLISSTSPEFFRKELKTWEEAEKLLGFSPWNPLEDAEGFDKASTFGEPLGGLFSNQCAFSCYAERTGKISMAELEAHYRVGEININMTAYLSDNLFKADRENPQNDRYPKVTVRAQEAESAETSEEEFDCIVAPFRNGKNASADFLLTKSGQTVYSIKLNTSSGTESLKPVYDKVCDLLGIEPDFERLFSLVL